MKVTKVTSGRNDNRVALWERHPAHPGGEIFVAGARVVEAAETPAVSRAISAGRLVVVEVAPPVAPGELTVDEALAALQAAGGPELAAALEAERAGKNRVTLVSALEARLEEE